MSRQARSLDVLLAEVNAAHGRRSKVSDGGLGDPAHASRASDHNPNGKGVWRARDFTDDDVDDNRDGNGDDMFDCDDFAKRLVAMYHAPVVHPAMRSGAYTIWKSRIYSYDRRDEGWRPYTGPNPHDKHLHQSVATAAAGYDSTAPWGVMEKDMANSDEILAELKAIRKAAEAGARSAAHAAKFSKHSRDLTLALARQEDTRDDASQAKLDALIAVVDADVESETKLAALAAVVDEG